MASLMVTLIDIAGSYYLLGILDEYIPNQLISTLGIISIGFNYHLYHPTDDGVCQRLLTGGSKSASCY